MSNRQIGQIATRNMSYDIPFHNHKIQLAPEPGAGRSSRCWGKRSTAGCDDAIPGSRRFLRRDRVLDWAYTNARTLLPIATDSHYGPAWLIQMKRNQADSHRVLKANCPPRAHTGVGQNLEQFLNVVPRGVLCQNLQRQVAIRQLLGGRGGPLS